MQWKIGQLAGATGLTVRTLHHYDEIGLLSPSHRSEKGYRLYGEADVAKLQRILSLRQLGFPLDAIRDCLERPEFSPSHVIALHLAKAREQLEASRALCERLETLAWHFERGETVSAQEFLHTIEAINMFEKYYTEEQLAQLAERAKQLGPEGMQAAQEEWPRLIAQVKEEMAKGTDPKSEVVQALARRWQGLIDAFTGGDAGIAKSLSNLYANEPSMRERSGVDAEIADYVRRASN